MDSLTHLVAGALTPLAFPGAPRRAAVLGFGIAVGELPDIDIFFGSGTPEAFLTLHRGITHALAWQPVLALAALLPFYLLLRRRQPAPASAPFSARGPAERFSPQARPAARPPGSGWADSLDLRSFGIAPMYFAALLALFTHIYLDCMTAFGTQALLPFAATRVSFPSMFIIDLLLTIPAGIILIAAWRLPPDIFFAHPAPACVDGSRSGKKTLAPAPVYYDQGLGTAFFSRRARHLALVGLGWILLYPLASLGMNALATRWLAPEITPLTLSGAAGTSGGFDAAGQPENARPVGEPELTLMTEPFSPLVWKAIIDDGATYRMSSVFLSSPARSRFETYVKPEPALYESLKKQHPLFTHFEDFCSFMVQTERPASFLTQAEHAGQVTEYAFADLRYIMALGSPARWFGRTDANFILEARVNESGALLAYRFLRRGKAGQTPWIAVQ